VWTIASRCRIGLTLVLAALVGGRGAGLAAQDRVYVAVADKKHKPVAGLSASDFRVTIDDTVQEIASVATATDPVSVVIP